MCLKLLFKFIAYLFLIMYLIMYLQNRLKIYKSKESNFMTILNFFVEVKSFFRNIKLLGLFEVQIS